MTKNFYVHYCGVLFSGHLEHWKSDPNALQQGTDLQGGPDRLQLLGDIIRKQAGNAGHRRTEQMAEGRERVLSSIL